MSGGVEWDGGVEAGLWEVVSGEAEEWRWVSGRVEEGKTK